MGRGRKRACEEIVIVIHFPDGMDASTCFSDIFERYYEEQLCKLIAGYNAKDQLAMLRELDRRVLENDGMM